MVNSEKIYKVLFKGEILPGFDKVQVIENVHNLTKIPNNIITRKFFSGKTVVIRHADNEEYAKQLQATFSEAGIQTHIEQITTTNDSSDAEGLSYDEFNKSTKNNNIIKTILIVIVCMTIGIFFLSDEEDNHTHINSTSNKNIPEGEIQSPIHSLDTSPSQTTKALRGKHIIPENSVDEKNLPPSINSRLFSPKEDNNISINETQTDNDEKIIQNTVIVKKSDVNVLADILVKNQETALKTTAIEDKKTETIAPENTPLPSEQKEDIALVKSQLHDKEKNSQQIIALEHSNRQVSNAILSKKQETNSINSIDEHPQRAITSRKTETLREIGGYIYSESNFDIILDELLILLTQENQDYMDHFDRKTVKLLSSKDKLKKIKTDNETELYQIGNIFIVKQTDKILSVTLEIDFLFKDSPFIHGSYSIRVLPIIKRKYPFFLSKFINDFEDKNKQWWDNNIETLKNNNIAESIQIMDSQHTIFIKYTEKISSFTNFLLSDYANKELFNDRLSITIVKN